MCSQGRWGPAARLAWVRCVLSSATDVSAGQLLTNEAPNSFPGPGLWTSWAIFLEAQWAMHINNIVASVIAPPGHIMAGKMFFYRIKEDGVAQFEQVLCDLLYNTFTSTTQALGTQKWSLLKLQSFIHHTVRGFLKLDLYNAVTEMLSRAEGSFGLQVHCTLEPGVAIIASKGQPMSIAFDEHSPLVLFASEAQALCVPVRESGKSLPLRVDLDGHGEVVRVGPPRALIEGRFRDQMDRAAEVSPQASPSPSSNSQQSKANNAHSRAINSANILHSQQCLILPCGVEVRSYLLNRFAELTASQLRERCDTQSAPDKPYDQYADLVVLDLNDTPAVLNAIDKGNE